MTTDDEPGPALQTEIQRIETLINSPQMRNMRKDGRPAHTGIRPRNAATLVILDRDGGRTRILMGKRHRSLAFMPGALVFPGGRVDPSDGSIPAAGELPAATRRKLLAHMSINASPRGARALGMAALRELAEETGLLLGTRGAPFPTGHAGWQAFRDEDVAPSLSGLVLLARAITPPGPPRRFDTWFFVARAEDIAHVPQGGFTPCGELEELRWIRPEEAMDGETREITGVMLVELMHRLERDPGLDPEYPAPFYQSVRRRFQKTMMP